MFQCWNAVFGDWRESSRGWTGPGSRCVTSVWWHGRKLRARVALTAAFAHSNAPCRPRPRPLSCCQHTDRLSWIISYLPNLSLQRRAPFGGALNRAAMVHRLQAPLMDTLLSLSLSFCLAVFSNPGPALFLPSSLNLALRCMPSLSFHFCLSAVWFTSESYNLRGRVE